MIAGKRLLAPRARFLVALPTRAAQHYTYLGSEQETQIDFLFVFGWVFDRFSAVAGPRNVPNGPGLKNTT